MRLLSTGCWCRTVECSDFNRVSECWSIRKVKFAVYRDAGVQELWLADPLVRSVVIHGWRNGAFVEVERGGVGDEVGSSLLPGFRLKLESLFP
jgi:Uma2 family endonuclease